MNVLDDKNLAKLEALNNEHVLRIVNEYIALCKPSKVTVITDSKEDVDYVRNQSIVIGEEAKLSIEGHTIHYDGFFTRSTHDQARDKGNTRILIPKGEYNPPALNTIDREEGLKEVLEIMDGCMEGHECIVRLFCLGPKNSKFSILALQLT